MDPGFYLQQHRKKKKENALAHCHRKGLITSAARAGMFTLASLTVVSGSQEKTYNFESLNQT